MRLLTRPLLYAATPIVVALSVSVLPYAAGRDPALGILRARAVEREPDPAALAAVRDELGLPDGPVEAAGQWLAQLGQGDLGTSWVSGDAVLPLVGSAAGASLTLTASAVLVAALIATVLTGLSLAGPTAVGGNPGPRRWSVRRTLARRTALGAAAVPELLLAAGCVWFAALDRNWPHTAGWSGPGDLALPALALALPLGGVLAVVMQQAALASLHEPWVRTWVGFGRPDRHIAGAAFRRGLAVAAPLLGLTLGGVLGGAVLVESLFGIPGLGRLALASVASGDLPVLQAALLVLVGAGMAAGLAGESLRGWLQRAPGAQTADRHRDGHPLLALLAWSALALLLVLGLPRDPTGVALEQRHAVPTWGLPFGADHLGRDLLARTAHGAVVTVGPALLITALALAIALLVSTLNAGGRLTGLVGNALPPVVTGLLVAAALGPGSATAVVAVTSVAWIPLATHARALVAEQRASEHVAAAVVLGLGRGRIHRTEVLPAVLPALLRHAAARVAPVCLALTGLAFLGLGAQPPSASWGLMLRDGLPDVGSAPLAVLLPAVGLLLVAFATEGLPHPRRLRRPHHTARRAPNSSRGQVDGSVGVSTISRSAAR